MPLPLLATAGIQAAAGAIPGLAGMIGRKNRIKKNEPYQNYRRAIDMIDESDAGIDAQMGQSYLDTAEGSAISGQIQDRNMSLRDSINNSSDFGGLSDEARLSGLGKVNEAEGQALSSLAGNAEARRRNLMSQKGWNQSQRLNSLSQAFGMENQIRGQNQQQMNTLGQGLSGAANSFMLSDYFQAPGQTNGFGNKAMKGFGSLEADFRRNVPRLGQMA